MKDNERSKRLIGQDTRRRDLNNPEREHDPYKAAGKRAGPLVCPQCQVVFDGGRWRRMSENPANAAEETCPACHRIKDKYPAGEIRVSGDFSVAHREEILNLIRNCETRESSEHPLSRIMAIDAGKDLIVTTTDIHLPRVIGNALERAFKVQAEFQYDQPGHFVRVLWRREGP